MMKKVSVSLLNAPSIRFVSCFRERQVGKKLFLIAVAGMISMGCDAKDEEVPKGEFIRAIGNQIYVVNFEKNTNKLFYEFPLGTVIEDKISQIDRRTILLSLPEEGKILTIDLKSKTANYIGVGLNPVYMPKHEKIVYYGKDSDGVGALLVANRYLEEPIPVTKSSRYDLRTIVKISSDEVVFQKKEYVDRLGKRENGLWKFNVSSHNLTKLDSIEGCLLLNVFRNKTSQLVCQKITTNRFDTYYYLVDLSGNREERLNFEGYLSIGEYIEEMDSIVIQKPRVVVGDGSTSYDLWLYDLDDDTSHLMMKNAGFAIDAFLRILPRT
ncbi:MAG: hypothetical protein GXP15_17665 [Gammaproteobacteria bacterium]|nr:hypothetical protein [Gammaproteobacteria bacterium]